MSNFVFKMKMTDREYERLVNLKIIMDKEQDEDKKQILFEMLQNELFKTMTTQD